MHDFFFFFLVISSTFIDKRITPQIQIIRKHQENLHTTGPQTTMTRYNENLEQYSL